MNQNYDLIRMNKISVKYKICVVIFFENSSTEICKVKY